MSEDFVDSVVASLKILAMIRKNSKLCVKRGQLAIDHSDHFQGVRRWITKDSREVTLMHIRNTINNALKITRALIPPPPSQSIPTHPHHSYPYQHQYPHAHMTDSQAFPGDLQEWTLLRVVEEMRNCETGLQNLRTTYIDDSSTVAAVDVLAERLRANCDDIDSKLAARRSGVAAVLSARDPQLQLQPQPSLTLTSSGTLTQPSTSPVVVAATPTPPPESRASKSHEEKIAEASARTGR